MPGFVPDSEQVIPQISIIHIPLLCQLFKDMGASEPLREIVYAQSPLTDIKVAGGMVGITGRSQGTGSQRKVTIVPESFIQKQVKLLNNPPYPGGKQHLVAHTFFYLFIFL